LGIYTAKLDVQRCIYVTSEQLQVSHHHYQGVSSGDIVLAKINRRRTDTLGSELIPRNVASSDRPRSMNARSQTNRFESAESSIGLNKALDEQTTVVIADIGDSLFAATELVVHNKTDFISPAYYTSMGFSVPASVGACVARPNARVLVIAGDGAFQMTGQELSTIVRRGFSLRSCDCAWIIMAMAPNASCMRAIGNTTRFIAWNYHQLPAVYGGGKGYLIRTEGEFEDASGASLERSIPDAHLTRQALWSATAARRCCEWRNDWGKRVESGDTTSRQTSLSGLTGE
jgi:indolepyruvate decarboxylase